jgi:hypothetical protein
MDAYAEKRRELFPEAIPVAAFVERTKTAIEPFGFEHGNALAMIAICRDELMFEARSLVERAWGPLFSLAGLAAMAFLGRTGLAAAEKHAPGGDGRRRFVVYALPHIGIDRGGVVGSCLRAGQTEPSSACGALVAFRDELVRGVLDVDLDPHDLELSLLRQRLLRNIPYGHVPDLVEMTELARDAILADLTELARQLERRGPTDLAVFTGIVIHGPEGDWVAPARSYVHIGDDHDERALSL